MSRLAIVAGTHMAATISWRGGNGHWAQQAQWLPLQLPGAGQDVLLGSGSYTVTVTYN